MRRFASVDLEPMPAAPPDDGEAPTGAADTGMYALDGQRAPLLRGLYRLSFRTTAPDGDHVVALGYSTCGKDRRRETIRLPVTARRGRVSVAFIIPEPAENLTLRTGDTRLLADTRRLRLTRMSSLLAKGMKAARRALSMAAQPSRWMERAAKALRIVRSDGIAGLSRALRQGGEAEAIERNFEIAYRQWAMEEDRRLSRGRNRLAAEARELAVRPLISVVLPVYDPSPDMLEEAIDSVANQVWPHWELCIADDASSDPRIRQVIERRAEAEPRIRTVFRGENGHISAASNSALAVATGDWVTFLDHDDVLAPHALLETAKAIGANPHARMIYSDEDKIDPEGQRCFANFKPDWNEELFLTYNLVTHLACYRADLVREVGGFRQGYEGAQDYDLALRVAEKLDASQIVHIPAILYHWRMHELSTSTRADAKPYAMAAGEKALNSHYARAGVDAVARLEGGFYRTRHTLPDNPPLVSIVIATRDRLDLLDRCVASILANTDYPAYEIIVVDNGSAEQSTLDWLSRMENAGKLRVLRCDMPFNFSALNNAGVAAARGEIVALLNNDTETVKADWLGELVASCLQEGVGVVGAKLLYPEGTVQHAGLIVNGETVASHWFLGYPGDRAGPYQRLVVRQAVTAVTGACLVTPKQLYLDLGGLDEANLAVAYNDVDYCLKVGRAGLRVVFNPFATLIHHESASRGKDVTPARSERLFAEMVFMKDKWGDTLRRDPMGMPGMPGELAGIRNLAMVVPA